MTDRGKIRNKFEKIRRTELAATMIITAVLIATVSVGLFMNQHSVYAQMMGGHDSVGNRTSDLQEDQRKMTINGTINLEQTIIEAIDSKVNVSLTQAITTAERSVGSNSFALAAFGADQGGFLAYTIILGTPGTEFYHVIVDPGNGQILSSQKSTQSEIEMMHLKHSKAIVKDAGTGVEGFGLRALRH